MKKLKADVKSSVFSLDKKIFSWGGKNKIEILNFFLKNKRKCIRKSWKKE